MSQNQVHRQGTTTHPENIELNYDESDNETQQNQQQQQSQQQASQNQAGVQLSQLDVAALRQIITEQQAEQQQAKLRIAQLEQAANFGFQHLTIGGQRFAGKIGDISVDFFLSQCYHTEFIAYLQTLLTSPGGERLNTNTVNKFFVNLEGIEHYSCNPIPRPVNNKSTAETFQLHLVPGFIILGPRNKADFTAIGCSVSYLSDLKNYIFQQLHQVILDLELDVRQHFIVIAIQLQNIETILLSRLDQIQLLEACQTGTTQQKNTAQQALQLQAKRQPNLGNFIFRSQEVISDIAKGQKYQRPSYGYNRSQYNQQYQTNQQDQQRQQRYQRPQPGYQNQK